MFMLFSSLQKLASLFYRAAREGIPLNPAKVEEILGLNEEEANAESDESVEAASVTDGAAAKKPEVNVLLGKAT